MQDGWTTWVLGGWAIVAAMAWGFAYLRGAWMLWKVPRLQDVSPREPDAWPKLSLVIPARNEADTIEAAVETLLAQDHPKLEIFLVDDRSTDGTGAIVDRLAEANPRIGTAHVEQLPEGWLGKVHALHTGLSRTTGEWVLFTDADVHYAQGALRKAHALAMERELDMLVLMPRLICASLLHEATVDAFGGFFFQAVRPAAAADPQSDAYVGAGAFNLVRRRVLGHTEGFEFLRMEVADDVGLGLVMKRAGARLGCWLATKDLSVEWYPSLAAMARGLEKNLFAVLGRYQLGRTVALLVALTAVILGPLVGLFLFPAAIAGSSLAFVSLIAFAFAIRARMPGHRLTAALFIPVGQLLIVYMVARSAWVCLRNGGIEWRGTRYPLEQLADLQRVKV